MLLLGYLLTASDKWRNAKVSVITVVESEAQRTATQDSLSAVLQAAPARILHPVNGPARTR